MPQGIDHDSNLALYADDTKIWRKISNDKDLAKLQKDIDYLYSWSQMNKMNFHPKKCKMLSINHKPSPLSMLPFVLYHYTLGANILQYTDNERDLGVDVCSNFSFNDHCKRILSRANQKFGLLRRTCHFVNDIIKRRKILYLTLVRSQFEHCSQIWRPNNKSMMKKFESIQKKCIKWVLFEEELSYSCKDVYVRKCKQVGILPICQRFHMNDLILFHKIINHLLPVKILEYLSLFSGQSRLHSSHLDRLSFVSSSNTLNK